MKVIKKGNKNYVYYIRCQECGSIISFMNSELDWAHRLNCPICKNSVYVNMQLYENDPYLGDQEVEKEVEEYLEKEKEQRAPVGKPAYLPRKKGDVTVKVDSESIDEIVNRIKDSGKAEGILEKLLKEVAVEPLPTYIKDGRPYEPSKTSDWSNPYGVDITLLNK